MTQLAVKVNGYIEDNRGRVSLALFLFAIVATAIAASGLTFAEALAAAF